MTAKSDIGGEVKDAISDCLLHEAFEGRDARLFWGFSSQKARDLRYIDGSSQSYMTQMGFALPDIT